METKKKQNKISIKPKFKEELNSLLWGKEIWRNQFTSIRIEKSEKMDWMTFNECWRELRDTKQLPRGFGGIQHKSNITNGKKA